MNQKFKKNYMLGGISLTDNDILQVIKMKNPEVYADAVKSLQDPDDEARDITGLNTILIVLDCLRGNYKIKAIKEVRARHGLGLKEAKEYVESFEVPLELKDDETWSNQRKDIKPEILNEIEYYRDKYPEYFV